MKPKFTATLHVIVGATVDAVASFTASTTALTSGKVPLLHISPVKSSKASAHNVTPFNLYVSIKCLTLYFREAGSSYATHNPSVSDAYPVFVSLSNHEVLWSHVREQIS